MWKNGCHRSRNFRRTPSTHYALLDIADIFRFRGINRIIRYEAILEHIANFLVLDCYGCKIFISLFHLLPFNGCSGFLGRWGGWGPATSFGQCHRWAIPTPTSERHLTDWMGVWRETLHTNVSGVVRAIVVLGVNSGSWKDRWEWDVHTRIYRRNECKVAFSLSSFLCMGMICVARKLNNMLWFKMALCTMATVWELLAKRNDDCFTAIDEFDWHNIADIAIPRNIPRSSAFKHHIFNLEPQSSSVHCRWLQLRSISIELLVCTKLIHSF